MHTRMSRHHVLHRDLKTQNVFLLGNGRLVLGDLGISKVFYYIVTLCTFFVGNITIPALVWLRGCRVSLENVYLLARLVGGM